MKLEGPVAIRYPRGEAAEYSFEEKPVNYGKGEILLNGDDGIIIAEGTMVKRAIQVCEALNKQNINMTLVNIRFIKPLDEHLLDEMASKAIPIYTLEDNIFEGGFGSSILEYYSSKEKDVALKIFAHKNGIITHGETSELMKLEKLDNDSICEAIISDIRVRKNGER